MRALSFTPAFWAFAFPPANMALFPLRWLELEHPAGSSAYAWVLVAAVTVLIRAIAARTIVAVWRGEYFPPPQAPQRFPPPLRRLPQGPLDADTSWQASSSCSPREAETAGGGEDGRGRNRDPRYGSARARPVS